MKKIIFIVISSCLLLSTGCKKCYRCANGCFKKFSTGELICSTDFGSYTEFQQVADSLGSDVDWGGANSYVSFTKKACTKRDLGEYEAIQGVSCAPVND